MGKIFSDYVKSCQAFWSKHHSTFSTTPKPVTNLPHVNQDDPYPGFEVAVFNDFGNPIGSQLTNPPQDYLIEDYNGGDETPGGLLIVGCNPSGIAKHSYLRKLYSGIYIVNTFVGGVPQDTYTKTIEEFANACGYRNHHYKMDIFGILQVKQSILRDDIEDKNQPHLNEYRELFEIFVDTIISLEPKKIVIANAFISKLIKGRSNVFKQIINGHVSIGKKRNNKGGLPVIISNKVKSIESTIWFSSMLSGQRALDNGSKGLLTWAVHK